MNLAFVQNMGGGTLIVLFAFSLAYLALWVYCLVDVINGKFKDPNMKMIWVIILIFAHGLGPIAYLIIGKSSKNK